MSARLIVASEELASGNLTRRDLMRSYAKIHRNVYCRTGTVLTAADRARAAWLWSGRAATLSGHSAAAMLGAKWIPPDAPVELARIRRAGTPGILIHSGRITDDEVCEVDGINCTTVARTAYDLGRRLHLESGVIRIDDLLGATRTEPTEVYSIAERHPGARGIRQLRETLGYVDTGAESPQETRLRLLLVRSGIRRPATQIPVRDHWGEVVRRIDMGWPEYKVGAEYDGQQHWTNPDIHAGDIERLEFLAAQGWLIVRVSARQMRYQRSEIVRRVRDALASRGYPT